MSTETIRLITNIRDGEKGGGGGGGGGGAVYRGGGRGRLCTCLYTVTTRMTLALR